MENSRLRCQIKNIILSRGKTTLPSPGPLTLWPSFCSLNSNALLDSGFLDFWISYCLAFYPTPTSRIGVSFTPLRSPTWLTKTNLPTLYSHSTENLSFGALSTVVTLLLGILFDVGPFSIIAPLRLQLCPLSLTIVALAPSMVLNT